MTQTAQDKNQVNLALEVSLHIALAIMLAAACFLILRPFIPVIVWGIIIAVAAYPGFRRLQLVLGGRAVLSAIIFTVLLLALLIVPVALLTGTLIEGVQTLTTHLKGGTIAIPPPPAGVAGWPMIGAPLTNVWGLASKDLPEAIKGFAPQIKALVPLLLSVSAGIGLTGLEFGFSIVVAGILLGNAEAAYEVTCSLANRIFGAKGPDTDLDIRRAIPPLSNPDITGPIRLPKTEERLFAAITIDGPPVIFLHIVIEEIDQGIDIKPPLRKIERSSLKLRSLVHKRSIRLIIQFARDQDIIEGIVSGAISAGYTFRFLSRTL